jgi:hypothetical protein
VYHAVGSHCVFGYVDQVNVAASLCKRPRQCLDKNVRLLRVGLVVSVCMYGLSVMNNTYISSFC